MPGMRERMENVNGHERRNPHGSLLSQALRGDSNGHSQHSLGAVGSMRGGASQRSSEESLHSLEFRPDGSLGAAKSMPRASSQGNQTSPAEVPSLYCCSMRVLPLKGASLSANALNLRKAVMNAHACTHRAL